MSVNYPIGDMVARIRNGQMASLAYVNVPYSKIHSNILNVMKSEGYINEIEESEVRKGVKELKVHLKYVNGNPAIKELKIVSKPGRRVYRKVKEMKKVYNGLGTAIFSTPQGVLADHECRRKNVAGEMILCIF
jgi:small subunit ribosomal protein S8